MIPNLKIFVLSTIVMMANTVSINASEEPQRLLYPSPQSVIYGEGVFNIDNRTTIFHDNHCEENATFLQKELQALGFRLSLQPIETGISSINCISLRLRRTPVQKNNSLPNSPGREGYEIQISREKITITGYEPAGQLYGIFTLLRLLEPQRRTVPCLEITDRPVMQFRGLRGHFPKNNPLEIARFKNIIRAMAFCRLNQLWIRDLYARRFPASIKWISHPEINLDAPITKELAGELISYAEKFNVKVMGSLASLADQVWSVYPDLIEMGPHENPGTVNIRSEKNRTKLYRFGSRFNLCPSREETYRLYFDLFDEMAPMFSSEIFDLGVDEVGQPYNGSRWVADRYCKGKDPVELFARYVNRLADHVSNSAKIPLMNSTTLVKEHGGSFHDIYRSISMIRKDIIINNWSEGAVRKRSFYKRILSFKSSAYFKKYGFDRIIHMTGYDRRWRDRPELLESLDKTDCYGAVITHYRYMTGEEVLSENTIDDMAFSGGHFWTPSKPEINSAEDEKAISYSKSVINGILAGEDIAVAIQNEKNATWN